MNSSEIPGDLSSQPLVIRLVMIGWHGVGKTSFLLRFHEGSFPHQNQVIGVDFRIHREVKEGRECKYQIWDFQGGERFREIIQSYYRSARGFLIFVDLSIDTPIEEQLDHWMKQIEICSSDNVCKFLIGSKCDLPQLISDEAFEQYAQQYNMPYFKTSAQENINITEAMESIMESVFQQVKAQDFQNIQLLIRYPNAIKKEKSACC